MKHLCSLSVFSFLVLKIGHIEDPYHKASVFEGSKNGITHIQPLQLQYFKCFTSNCWCTIAAFSSSRCICVRTAIPACSARALWLRSRCCSFVLTVSAWASCSAASSVKLFPDRLIFTRVQFLWSMSATALAPQSPRLLSERSTSGIHTQVHRKIYHLLGAGTGKRKKTALRPEGTTFFKKGCRKLKSVILPILILKTMIAKVPKCSTVYLTVND